MLDCALRQKGLSLSQLLIRSVFFRNAAEVRMK